MMAEEEVRKVEAVVIPDDCSTVFVDNVDVTKALPEDKEECLQLIQENCLANARMVTLRFWQIGRIIATLIDRGEKKVMEDAMRVTKYKKRVLQYTQAVYRKFPEYALLEQVCGQGVEWCDFRDLLKLKSEEDKDTVMKLLVSGDLERDEIKDKVDELNNKHFVEEEVSGASPELPIASKQLPETFFKKWDKAIHKFEEKIEELTSSVEDQFIVMEGDTLTDEQFDNAIKMLNLSITRMVDCNMTLQTCEKKCSKFVEEIAVEEAPLEDNAP